MMHCVILQTKTTGTDASAKTPSESHNFIGGDKNNIYCVHLGKPYLTRQCLRVSAGTYTLVWLPA